MGRMAGDLLADSFSLSLVLRLYSLIWVLSARELFNCLGFAWRSRACFWLILAKPHSFHKILPERRTLTHFSIPSHREAFTSVCILDLAILLTNTNTETSGLVIAILAAIVASQAMITGAFRKC
jgi:hypothetical protein